MHAHTHTHTHTPSHTHHHTHTPSHTHTHTPSHRYIEMLKFAKANDSNDDSADDGAKTET